MAFVSSKHPTTFAIILDLLFSTLPIAAVGCSSWNIYDTYSMLITSVGYGALKSVYVQIYIQILRFGGNSIHNRIIKQFY